MGLRLPAGMVNKTHFDKAREVLRRFDLVIPQELINEDQIRSDVNHLFGWTLQDGSLRTAFNGTVGTPLNFTTHNTTLSQLQKEKLQQINRFDIELYKRFALPY